MSWDGRRNKTGLNFNKKFEQKSEMNLISHANKQLSVAFHVCICIHFPPWVRKTKNWKVFSQQCILHRNFCSIIPHMCYSQTRSCSVEVGELSWFWIVYHFKTLTIKFESKNCTFLMMNWIWYFKISILIQLTLQ